MDSGGVPGRTSSLPEVSCKIRNNVGARGNARITYPVHAPWNFSYLPLETRISVSVTHLSLPISYSRDKSRAEIVTTLPKIAYIWTRLDPRSTPKVRERKRELECRYRGRGGERSKKGLRRERDVLLGENSP